MQNEPLVSVIVPIYNAEKYLKDALLSIAQQTYKNIEVILINDGSTDISSDIIADFCSIDSRFKAVHVKNGGVSKARNIGLSVSKGEKIYFMDSDDRIEEDLIETMVKAGVDNDLVISGLYIEYPQESRQVVISKDKQRYSNRQEIALFLQSIDVPDISIYLHFIWNKLFEKSIIDNYRIHFDDEIRLGEDFLFIAEYIKHVESIEIISVCLYHYYRRNTASLTRQFDRYELKRRWRMNQASIDLYDAFDIPENRRAVINKNEGKFCLKSLEKITFGTCILNKKEKIEYISGFLDEPEINYMITYLQSEKGLENHILKYLIKFRFKHLLYYWFSRRQGLHRQPGLQMSRKSERRGCERNESRKKHGYLKKFNSVADGRKIGILTFSSAHNNGAVLQCYSLCEYLNKRYGKTEIIDFTPRFLDVQQRLIRINRSSLRRAIGSLLRSFARMPFVIKKKRSFDKFRAQNCRYSDKKYRYIYPEDNYDLYVVGSDQVFNFEITHNELQFFLPHIADPTKKVTYAASLGVSEVSDEEKRVLVKGLSNFGYISIRERSGQKIISDLFPDRKIYRNIDPVFLTDKSRWLSLVGKKRISESYILIFTFVAFERAYELAKKYDKDMRIVTCFDSYKKRKDDTKNVMAVGPIEFLTLIYYADCVITDSFHCTAFSIIFNKEFYCIPYKGTETRMTDMLTDLRLESRICNSSDISIERGIDYGHVENIITDMKKETDAYFDLFLK